MIKAIPVVVVIIIAIVLIGEFILVPLYKYINKKIMTTRKEINKIK